MGGRREVGFETWILGSMSSGIVGIDAEGAIAAFNAGAQRILGCPEGELSAAFGRDCREVLVAQPTVVRLLLETLDRKSPLSRAELVLAGEASTIGFTLCPVRDGEDRVQGAAMIFRDLTPIERGDEQERLRERLAALGQMAAGLAHEIRNPLAGMEVLAGLLQRRLADRPEEQALVRELKGELRSLAAMVTASLEFVRPVAPVVVRVDPVQLLNEALTTARARVSFDGTVERAWDAELPPLEADEDQLRSMLVDLIVNALEAMSGLPDARLSLSVCGRDWEAGGRAVRVGADGAAAAECPARRELLISIADSGPGVPPEMREKIFYPFFSTKRRGSGVGLASAQKIVASHAGSLELVSRPGRGCRFRVRLPAASDAAA
jgi:nitrogen-specific signal transduction histidine kinase